jgi:hypothetical protein
MAPSADIADVDLCAPFERDTILEIRTGKMKAMPGLTIQSGIEKKLRSGKIPVTFLGLDADEHDLTFHGGKDKAIHGCKSSCLFSIIPFTEVYDTSYHLHICNKLTITRLLLTLCPMAPRISRGRVAIQTRRVW